MVFGGSATCGVRHHFASIAAGGAVFGGSAECGVRHHFADVGSGGMEFGGDAEETFTPGSSTVSYAHIASGGMVFGGSASCTFVPTAQGPGASGGVPRFFPEPSSRPRPRTYRVVGEVTFRLIGTAPARRSFDIEAALGRTLELVNTLPRVYQPIVVVQRHRMTGEAKVSFHDAWPARRLADDDELMVLGVL